MSATSLRTRQSHSTGPSGSARERRALPAGASAPSLIAVIPMLAPSAIERRAHLAERFDDIGPPRLRPFGPIRLHGVDCAGHFFGLGLGEGVSHAGEDLHRLRFLFLHGFLVPA